MLKSLVSEQLASSVSRQVAAICGKVRTEAARIAGGDPDKTIAAVLGYGSCLRDVSPAESLADFYVLMADDSPVSSNVFARFGCRFAAPNVYYAECQHEGVTLRAKYAVLPLAQFEARVSHRTQNPYFWARFSQPSALIYAQPEQRERVENAISVAVATMLKASLPLAVGEATHRDVWLAGLKATYGTELRSESASRAETIISANLAWYDQTAIAVLRPELSVALAKLSNRDWAAGRATWPKRRFRGKLLSVLRLIKAAFTFSGGSDYLAWKIKRHSGVEVQLSGWQRRHPILASVWLMPKLYFKGAFR